jgi:hypothetical protein
MDLGWYFKAFTHCSPVLGPLGLVNWAGFELENQSSAQNVIEKLTNDQ